MTAATSRRAKVHADLYDVQVLLNRARADLRDAGHLELASDLTRLQLQLTAIQANAREAVENVEWR